MHEMLPPFDPENEIDFVIWMVKGEMGIKRSISVVVPAYNAEAHLRACVESIVCQPEVGEVIIVDDGSTDDTNSIAIGLARQEEKVCLVSQQNSGVSEARNRGMRAVTLPYLAFVDADDLVPSGAFGTLLDAAEEFDADMVYGDYAVMRNGEVVEAASGFAAHEGKCPSSGYVISSLASLRGDTVTGACWRILYKTAFLERENLLFPIGITMSEDYCFVLRCLIANPVIAHVGGVVYLWRREGLGASQRYMPELEESMDYVNDVLLKACQVLPGLVTSHRENVANTAWAVCVNALRTDSPYDSSARRREIGRIMAKYRDAIRQIPVAGDLGCIKALALKAGTVTPVLLWMLMESRSLIRGGM